MFSLHEQNCNLQLGGTSGKHLALATEGPAAIALIVGPVSDRGERAVSFDLSFAPEVTRFSVYQGVCL